MDAAAHAPAPSDAASGRSRRSGSASSPSALAYAVTARGAGLSLLETQALSVFVFAGSAQFSAVGLFAAGAGGLEIVLTTLLLNVRHLLYGLSLGRDLPSDAARATRSRPSSSPTRPSASSPRRRSGRSRFLLGIELSLFVMWNLATLGGFLARRSDPRSRPSSASTSSSRSRSSRCSCRSSARGSSSLVAVGSGALAYGLARELARRPADPRHRDRRQPPRCVSDPRDAGRSRRSTPTTRRGRSHDASGSRSPGWSRSRSARATQGSSVAPSCRTSGSGSSTSSRSPSSRRSSRRRSRATSARGRSASLAAIVAAAAAWRTRQLWVAIVVGMAVFWLLRIPF